MKHFDYIFTGGGCAALSTALYLVREGLTNQQILIIDKEEKIDNDRTWCYWSKSGEHPFPDIVSHSWSQLIFADYAGEVATKMNGYQYHLVKSSDFYARVKAELSAHTNIKFHYGSVDAIGEEEGGLQVKVGEEIFSAGKVLNSIINLQKIRPQHNEYLLYQHFMGWFVESPEANFEVGKAHLMDFRTPQLGQSRFFYVLPFSENKALIEFTAFSKDLLADHQYRSALSGYINEVLQIDGFTIEEEEFGIIPMTNVKLSQQRHPDLIHIGTAGQQVKPTTGYAFLNIQKSARVLARQLARGEQVKQISTTARFAFYDHLLLHILNEDAGQGAKIFSALFRSSPMSRILDFLGEKSTLLQEGLIFAGLPYTPFIKALLERNGLVRKKANLDSKKGNIKWLQEKKYE